MAAILKALALGACGAALLCAAAVPHASFNLGFVREAGAGIIVAPVRRTAVATTAVVAASSANANAAAAANANATAQANAAAAQANAAAAQAKAATPAGPPPVGTVVTALPPGCVQDKLNNVAYMRCGSTYYTASMLGNNLVFVVAQP